MPAATRVALAMLFACAACARIAPRPAAPPPPAETAATPARQHAEPEAAATPKPAKPESAATAKAAKPEVAATASAKKPAAAAPHKAPETATVDRKAAETAQAAKPPTASKPEAVASAKPAAPTPKPAPPAAPATPTLDLKSLEQRLKDTDAIGVMTKLALKNQVDDLLDQFRGYYDGRAHTTLADLRRPFDLLLMKVLSLLQDRDPALARTIHDSREALWSILADRKQFEKLS